MRIKYLSYFLWLPVFLITSFVIHAQPPTTYAVIVGISDYQLLDYMTGDLRYADQDARQFSQFLMSQAGGNVPNQNIRLLTNKQAGKSAIGRALTLFQQARPKDRVILFFSGHGLQGAFVPADVRPGQPRSLLTYTEVRAYFKASQAGTKLCIADACMSGGMRNRQQVPSNTGSLTSNSQVALLMSSRATQSSIESGQLTGGVFTHYMLKGLKGAADTNQNRIVTIRELYRYVAPRVKRNSPQKQAPLFFGNFPDSLVLADLH